MIALEILAGAVLWTLAEYWIHRSIFHGKSRWSAAEEHRGHHRDVEKFATLYEKGRAALQVLPALFLILWGVLGRESSMAVAGGFTVTYLLYTRFHERAHTHAPRTAYGRWCRRVHFTHHFHTPHLNHGVTCPWWDRLFGTYSPVSPIVVPLRQAPQWLLDEKGQVKPEFEADYVLKASGKQRQKAA